jgi:hypothetical protein
VREGIIAGGQLGPAPTMVCATLPELLDDQAAWGFLRAGIPAAAGLRTGLRCVAAMARSPGDPDRLREIAGLARAAAAPAATGAWVPEHEAKELLARAGVDVARSQTVHHEHELATAIEELGGTIVLKVSASDLQHKSELGAVALGLNSFDDARAVYGRLSALAAECGGTVVAEEMIGPGVEVLVAARADALVPALVIGMGGIWTEVMADVVIVPLPASATHIERALRELRGARLLFGGRGQPPVDVASLSRLAQRTGEVLVEASLALVELNPVLVDEHGAVAVDAVMRRRARSASGAAMVDEEVVQYTT